MKMKAGQSFKCLFWAILYCVLYLVSASSEDDLMDFDFTDLKEIDWNYDNDGSNETIATTSTSENWKTNGHGVTFNEKDDENDVENQVHPFDWREKVLRNALSKALTNRPLRQKFVEVMPILRVLSKQQRLALSAIITAQVNAKKGQELKLDQVRMMFGDDQKLLIPIIYDIANLVGASARKYLQFNYDVLPPSAHRQKMPALASTPQLERRKLDLMESEDDRDDGTLPAAAMPESSLEDFFSDMPGDVLDPQSINEELQASSENSKLSPKSGSTSTSKRARRDATSSDRSTSEFVHKLIRSIPLSVNEEELQRGGAGRTVKLNTTSFIASSDSKSTIQTTSPVTTTAPSYQEIEDLAFASLNGTEISLTDTATVNEQNDAENEQLPNPEELIAGPRYRISGNKIRLIRPKIPPSTNVKRKRVQLPRQQQQRIKTSATEIGAASVPAPRKCERFTASMCIRTEDHPLDQIMGSIRRHKNAMTALLAEYHDKPLNLDFSEEFDDFGYNQRRREDEAGTGTGGSMCQSIVRYARPQKARSASGEWKYIVNTGQHTQTLRLEKCSNPQESCSYLAHNYRSHCSQIYNYHRLLSWDKTRGLHVDIFKVPTCCSCQIDGYRQQFPPLDTIKAKEFSPAYSPEPYSTINEELDYNDEEDEDDLSFQYSNKYNQHKRGGSNHGFDINELQLSSKNVRHKVQASGPTVGSYLTPPGSNEYDTTYAYKAGQHHHRVNSAGSAAATASRHVYSQLERRRPYKSLSHGFDTESRADLEIAPSETHTDKEVNFFGKTNANDKTRQVQQKRKRIYSVPHTATTTTTTSTISSSSNNPVTTIKGINATHRPGYGNGNGHGHGHGNGYGRGTFGRHGEHGQGSVFGSSSTAAVTYKTTATSPSYYTPGNGKHIIRSGSGNNSKSRYASSATSQSYVPSSPSSSSASSSSSSAASLSTTESPVYRQTFSPPASSYPSLYHISSIFNTTNSHISPNGGNPKRINYSYHPIIDFFESNSKRSLTSSTTSASSQSVFPTMSAYDERQTHITSNSHTAQLYPHKIPKYSSVSRTQLATSYDSHDHDDVNTLQRQRERRIGIGPDDDTIINDQSTIASIITEDNVWHPVLV